MKAEFVVECGTGLLAEGERPPMKYISVEWIHDDPDDPIWIYSEFGDDDYETRRVEQYRNGAFQWVDAMHEDDCTGNVLSSEKFTPIDEINDFEEGHVEEISKERFEEIWAQATAAREAIRTSDHEE